MRQSGAIGIDLGTDSVKAVAIETVPGESAARVVGVGAALGKGIRKGTITEPEEAGRAVKEAVRALEKSTGIKSRGAHIGIGGAGLAFQKSKGLVAVSRADGEITKEDASRAVQASETNLSRLQNKEVLHKFPVIYRVDNEIVARDPVGLLGIRLEAEVLFVTAFSQALKNAIKAFDEADVNIEEVIASPLAAAKAVLSEREKEVGVMLMDIGSNTTSIILFEEGLPYSLEVLPFGSANITHDIATGFRTTLEEAEKLKINYGSLRQESAPPKKTSRGGEDLVYGAYSKKKLSEIIEARLDDIFELAEKHLKKYERAGLLASGVALVGGGANLPGIEILARERLKLHARVAEPENLGGFKEKVKNPAWSVAVGAALTALDQNSSTSPFFRGRSGSLFHWLRAFLP
ncbi:MAG: cell division protein FtsA [Candidatus Giovannonibacteria bacterium]|nr:MAG: cell division protein FtsA [Candidatus Giovannonibacteria bacterium]